VFRGHAIYALSFFQRGWRILWSRSVVSDQNIFDKDTIIMVRDSSTERKTKIHKISYVNTDCSHCHPILPSASAEQLWLAYASQLCPSILLLPSFHHQKRPFPSQANIPKHSSLSLWAIKVSQLLTLKASLISTSISTSSSTGGCITLDCKPKTKSHHLLRILESTPTTLRAVSPLYPASFPPPRFSYCSASVIYQQSLEIYTA
jgi:hypothetical protein